VHLQNVTSRKSEYALLLRGYERAPITNVRLSDCRFDGVAKPDVLEHVKGLEFDNVTVNGHPRRKSEVRSQKLEHGS
jgi:hypothetical protein